MSPPCARSLSGLALAAVLLHGCGDTSAPGDAPDAGLTTPADGSEDAGDAEDGLEDTPTSLHDGHQADEAGDPDARDAVPGPEAAPADLTAPDTAPPAPPRVWLTVAEIPRAMNGSIDSVEPALSWRLRVNRSHVTLDAFAEADSGPVDWAASSLACDDGAGPRAMGPLEVLAPDHARVLVDALNPFADGAAVVCTLSAASSDPASHPPATAAFAFDAATLPPELDPFPATETWLVTLSRDLFATTVTPRGDTTAAVVSTHRPGGDGVPDLDEALFALGLASPAHPEATALVRSHLARRVATLTRRFYGMAPADDGGPGGTRPLGDPHAPRIAFVFEGEPEAAPLLALTPAELDAARVSRIALGGDGDPEDQAAGTFGRAWIDWNNQTTQDNTRYGVGVFPTALARAALNQPIAALLLGACRPDLGGVPFGADPNDASFIGRDVLPTDLPEAALARAELYDLVMRFASLGLASILAHEVGHSLGLVPSGPAPEGLFAEVDVDFVAAVTTPAHIDIPGMNLMQTGGAAQVGEILSGAEPRFEPLSAAYLRRMLVVGPVVD